MLDFFDEVKQLAYRIEGSLIFTLVRFLYSLYNDMFNNVTIMFINVFILIISFTASHLILHTHNRTITRLLYLIQKFSTLVLTQTLIKSVQPMDLNIQKFSTLVLTQTLIKSVQPMDLNNSTLVTLLQCLVSSLSLVILLTLLPKAFHASENGQQFMRLVLFMFTDNTEFLVKRIDFGWTLPFLAMAGFVFLFHTSDWYHGSAILVTLTKAFNLSLTNLMILSSWTVSIGSTEQMSQLTQLIGLLVLFDALQDQFPEFSAMRDYAVWQGAAQIYNLSKYEQIYNLSKYESISGVSLVIVCIFSIFVVQLSVKIKALVELSVLIVINVILHNITLIVSTIHNNDVVTIVILWLTIIEVVLEALKRS